jgi:hypothetical protein
MPSPDEVNRHVNPSTLHVPVDWVPITPGASALERPLRALRATNDCTVTVKTAGSGAATRSMRFFAGETRFGIITHVTAVSAGTVEGGV